MDKLQQVTHYSMPKQLFKIAKKEGEETETKPKVPKEEKVLLEWSAPSRPFKQRDRRYFTNIAVIAIFLVLIFLFMREFLLVATILAVAFVYYALNTVSPEETHHKITTHGVNVSGQLYPWGELKDFWLTEKLGSEVINIDTKKTFPARIFMLVGEGSKDKIVKTLSEHLPFQEKPKETLFDKVAERMEGKISLEK